MNLRSTFLIFLQLNSNNNLVSDVFFTFIFLKKKIRINSHWLYCTKRIKKLYQSYVMPCPNLQTSLSARFPTETGFPYHFLWANQQKADIKIFSWTQCEISKDKSVLHFDKDRMAWIDWVAVISSLMRRNSLHRRFFPLQINRQWQPRQGFPWHQLYSLLLSMLFHSLEPRVLLMFVLL